MSTARPTPRSRWFALVWIIPVALVLLTAVVLGARAFRFSDAGVAFLAAFPGASAPAPGTPVGFPAWLSWQHFFNSLLILLIVRTGWAVRTTTRPSAFWTRNNTGLIRTKGAPKRISLNLWFHFTLDALWVLNGIVFYVLIFVTGQWLRIVPTSWDVFPNAVSAALQYASLQWPSENGWINYNALQLLAYFTTVFIAAPLAILTGIRMSAAWPVNATRLNRVYPVTVARKLHLPIMIYFVAFIVVHVTLVLATGALKNLNHMYGGSDDATWVGFIIFAISIVVMIGAWVAARPLLLRPVASLMGKVSR